MRNKVILLVLLPSILLYVLFLYNNLSKDNQNIWESSSINKWLIQSGSNDLVWDIAIVNLVGKNWDKALCNTLVDLDYKEQCVDNSISVNASIKKDIKLCKGIENLSHREYCINNIYLETALNNTNEKVCDKISKEDIKNYCLYSVIDKKINNWEFKGWVEICDLLDIDFQKNHCIEVIKKS